jgi:apurinic endonuclease APN1
MKEMYLGAHVSSARGIYNAIKEAEKYKINTIQMMPTAPMRWATKNIPEEDIRKFVEEVRGSGVKKILIHGIYLTNLARKDKQLFHLGKMGLVVYLRFAEKTAELIKKENIDCEILGVCFHPGSQKELNAKESLKRIIYGIEWVLNEVPGKQKLLIETTAGTGNNMGDTLEELRDIRKGIKDKKRVGFVCDTQHMYASGYNWRDPEMVIKEVDKIIGIENVKAVHINDSMVELGSHKDRHANIGEGEIGKDAFKELFKKLPNIPFILETPSLKDSSTMKEEIYNMKKLAEI